MSKVTIQTVADKAGVSIKTVSRVLNKESAVRDSTREKVRAIIAELGYKPSPAARALASNSSKIIGLIYDNLSSAYVMAVQTGVLKACTDNGYTLVIHPCNNKSENLSQELISLVQKSRLDGLVLTPPITDREELVTELYDRKINLVNIAPGREDSNRDSVSNNDAEISYELIQYLIEQGHTKIGFISGDPDHGAAYKRLNGYKKALKIAGIKYNPSLVYQGDFSFESGERAGHSLLNLENRPTAIFASNDYMAAGVLKVAHSLNLHVPNDVSLVGFDDAPVSRQIWPSLTTIKQPVVAMAEAATKLLINRISDPTKQATAITLDSKLLLRESTKSIKSVGNE